MGSNAGKHRPIQVTANPEAKRGVLSEVEKSVLLQKQLFTELRGNEQEAFFKSLHQSEFKEDIYTADSSSLKGPAKKYQFWVKSDKIALESLFKEYITTDNDKQRLTEVKDLVPEDMETFLKKKEEEAEDLDKFIGELRLKIKNELQKLFEKYKSELITQR